MIFYDNLRKNINNKRNFKFVISFLFLSIAIFITTSYKIFILNTAYITVLNSNYKTIEESDVYVRFGMEAYDKILENYWMPPGKYSQNNIPELPEIFNLALQRVKNINNTSTTTNTREDVSKLIYNTINSTSDVSEKKQIILSVVNTVLIYLLPQGRSSLQSTQQKNDFRQIVNNINPSNNLYQNLGIKENSSSEEVVKAYKEKEKELKEIKTPEAESDLKKIEYAKKVLTDPATKNLYDQTKIEPTVFPHVFDKTLYLYISRISPVAFQEFVKAISDYSSNTELDSMIMDFRGNIGGSLDFLPNILGLFIGQNQYAFDLYNKGDKSVQRTSQNKLKELERYKDIAILTDNSTKSTAELTPEMFRHFNLAHIVGTKTGGWGTIENNYKMDTVIDPNEQFYLLLVNNLTLREDNLLIQGVGVDPDVDISDLNWKDKLNKYFDSQSLIKTLKNIATKDPIR